MSGNTTEIRYPECEKQRAVMDDARVLSAFWDWLMERYHLAQYQDLYNPDVLMPVHVDPTRLFAEYFEIDLDKLEKEKRRILEEFINAHPDQ